MLVSDVGLGEGPSEIGAFWKFVILPVAPAPSLGATVTVLFPKVPETNQGQQEPAGVKHGSLRTPGAHRTGIQRGFGHKSDV